MRRTYVDSGVLMAAAHGKAPLFERAMAILDDPDREFASSSFVRLEVLPKAVYHKQHDEAQFYREFFGAVALWADTSEDTMRAAEAEASACGLNAMDALHLAAAAAMDVVEIITTERPSSPMHRTTRVRVLTIHPDCDSQSWAK